MRDTEAMKNAATELIHKCYFPEYKKGTKALYYCLEYLIDHPEDQYLSLYKRVYDYAAHKMDTSTDCIERSIRQMIEYAYATHRQRIESVIGELNFPAGKKRKPAPMNKQVIYRILGIVERGVLK